MAASLGTRSAWARLVLTSVLLAPAARSAAQSYGLGDQVLTLGAAAFRPTQDGYQFTTGSTDGYLYGFASHVAPLTLPDGAEIVQICLYGYVTISSYPVGAGLLVSKLVPGGQAPSYQTILNSFVYDDIPIGYGTVCTAPFSYVFHDLEDIDADGSADPIAHSVVANVPSGEGFGGVRIFWRRQVSPPPDTPSFNDVLSDDPYFRYVEALVASGITSGCATNPPRYCPDAPLTRRQMAVFLAKALGLHWPN
jgi:S-layer homology domain